MSRTTAPLSDATCHLAKPADRTIVYLDTHDLMQPLEAIKKRGTRDVALNLLSSMRKAKRLWLITANPAYDLEGFHELRAAYACESYELEPAVSSWWRLTWMVKHVFITLS